MYIYIYIGIYIYMCVYIWGLPKIRGTRFGGPNIKDYCILGSDLGPPILGNYHIDILCITDPVCYITLSPRRTSPKGSDPTIP